MELGIAGKKALITGAGKGIGKEIAIKLAGEGVKVAIISRTESDLNLLLEELGGEEKGHYKLAYDLTEKDILKKVIDELKANFGELDIIVNNLGGTLDIKEPFCSMEDWRKLLNLNLEIAVELNNLIIPGMKKKGWGRIVNLSSVSSKENQVPIPYCTAKAALNAYTRSMGRLLAPDGIIMSAVLPGAILTKDGYWGKLSKENSEQVEKYLKDRTAMKRFGKPEEIASVVLFLCSEHASFCAGSIFPVDGGQGKFF